MASNRNHGIDSHSRSDGRTWCISPASSGILDVVKREYPCAFWNIFGGEHAQPFAGRRFNDIESRCCNTATGNREWDVIGFDKFSNFILSTLLSSFCFSNFITSFKLFGFGNQKPSSLRKSQSQSFINNASIYLCKSKIMFRQLSRDREQSF